MMPGLNTDVFHRQRQSRLIAEDTFMLRPVVLKHPVNILLLGADDQIDQKDQNLQDTLHQVSPPHGEVREKVQNAACQKGGQHQEQKDAHPHAQQHRQRHHGAFQLLT